MSAREMARSVWSWAAMAAVSPVLLAHEASHAAASVLFGVRLDAAGIVLERRDGARLPLLSAAFVLHEDIGYGPADLAITLAPTAWAVPALFFDGTPLGVFCALVALSGLSDVAGIAAWSLGLDIMEPEGDAEHVVLLGSDPDGQLEAADERLNSA